MQDVLYTENMAIGYESKIVLPFPDPKHDEIRVHEST